MRDTDVHELIATVGELNNKTMIVEPSVKGRVNINSYKGLSPIEMYWVKNMYYKNNFTHIFALQ